MQAAGLLSGGTPVIKKYKVAASHIAGIIVIRSATATAGVSTSTTTSVADAVGLVLERNQALAQGGDVVYSTTQGDDEAVYSVIVNPDLILRMLMSGGATASTALTAHDITTASAAGTVLTTGDDHSSPTVLDGLAWFTSGANVGQSRKITTVSTTAATVLVPFLNDTVVGDLFIDVPWFPGNAVGIELTSDLTQAQGGVDASGTAAFEPIDVELNGTADSYIHALAVDHVFGVST